MRKILLLSMLCCQVIWLSAQKNAPKWMDKGRKAIVTVTTYDKDNHKIQAGTGFYVSDTGEALSGYSLFKGAVRATVRDTEGKEAEVTRILGADELYDVIRFQVNVPKKVAFFPLAAEPLAVGATVYLLPFSAEKNIRFGQGPVTEVSKLKEPFSYYKMSIPLESSQVNAPLLTETGEVFGLAQEDASGKKEVSYAVSAGYAQSLAVGSADAFNSVYNAIGIRKAWPADPAQAQVALFLKETREDVGTYLETVNDFIATFPDVPDGYLSRASHYAYHRAELAQTPAEQSAYLDKAWADLETAGRFVTQKGEAAYNRAKLIYGVAISDTTLQDERWSLEAAMNTIREAIRENDLPLYRQLKGDMNFNAGKYPEAFDDYMSVNQSDMATPATWYWAAKAKQNTRGANFGDVIALLDSAVAKCGTPPSAEAAPYILERVDLKLKLMNYPAAIADYDLYFDALQGKVDDSFYYYREQAKFRANDLEGALADIRQAIRLSPDDPNYPAEEASVYMRMEKYDEALNSIANALKLAPEFAACYRLRGVCYVRQKKTAEACEALQKAKELGDPVADRLLKEHCK